jgi:hypothetical protein
MGCGCSKRDGQAVTSALGYKVVGADGVCRLLAGGVCRVFPTATAAARAASAAGVSDGTVVPVRGM